MENVIKRYDKYLALENVDYEFDITNDLVNRIFFEHIYPTTKLPYLRKNGSFVKSVCSQLNYVRRSLLNVKYHRNGKASGINEGYVYILTNPAWPTKFKIGSTISIYDRLSTYQSYSPFRDYKIETYFFTENRFNDEKELHKLFNADGEWITNEHNEFSSAIALFNTKRKQDKDFLKASLTQLVV